MCMFTGSVKNAERSFKEFKKSQELNYNVQSNRRAPWKNHSLIQKSEEFKKFLGFLQVVTQPIDFC